MLGEELKRGPALNITRQTRNHKGENGIERSALKILNLAAHYAQDASKSQAGHLFQSLGSGRLADNTGDCVEWERRLALGSFSRRRPLDISFASAGN